MKNLLKLSIATIIVLSMYSCTKDEVLVMKSAEKIKPDSTATVTPGVSGWGEGKGDTNNGEGY